MTAVFPSTTLRSNQPVVKRAAKDGPVIITDNNDQYYLFCSEEVFARQLRQEAEQAAYSARMAHGIRRAKEEISRGEFVVGAEEVIAQVRSMGNHE